MWLLASEIKKVRSDPTSSHQRQPITEQFGLEMVNESKTKFRKKTINQVNICGYSSTRIYQQSHHKHHKNRLLSLDIEVKCSNVYIRQTRTLQCRLAIEIYNSKVQIDSIVYCAGNWNQQPKTPQNSRIIVETVQHKDKDIYGGQCMYLDFSTEKLVALKSRYENQAGINNI